jgi:hypothetical protein
VKCSEFRFRPLVAAAAKRLTNSVENFWFQAVAFELMAALDEMDPTMAAVLKTFSWACDFCLATLHFAS